MLQALLADDGDGATPWDNGDDCCVDPVDNHGLNATANRRVMGLTGASSADQGWRLLVPDHTPGKVVGFRANLGNTCSTGNRPRTGGENKGQWEAGYGHSIWRVRV